MMYSFQGMFMITDINGLFLPLLPAPLAEQHGAAGPGPLQRQKGRGARARGDGRLQHCMPSSQQTYITVPKATATQYTAKFLDPMQEVNKEMYELVHMSRQTHGLSRRCA